MCEHNKIFFVSLTKEERKCFNTGLAMLNACHKIQIINELNKSVAI